MTQAYPLAMIAFGKGILPLIKNLKRDIPDATQDCNADDYSELVAFSRIETYFNSVTRQGLGRGYYPERYKILLIVHPENIQAVKVFFERHRFKVCTGAHYIEVSLGMPIPNTIV